MFELVVVEGGSRESAWFVTRLDVGKGFFNDEVIFRKYCAIRNTHETGMYVSGGRCCYHLPCFHEWVRY